MSGRIVVINANSKYILGFTVWVKCLKIYTGVYSMGKVFKDLNSIIGSRSLLQTFRAWIIVQLCFIQKNGQRKYKYLVLGRNKSYFVKETLWLYQKVIWNWYHQNDRVFDWHHICDVWWTCFSADSWYSYSIDLEIKDTTYTLSVHTLTYTSQLTVRPG